MPSQYDGMTPDAAAVPGCNWPTDITRECAAWNIVNPPSIDVGADLVQNVKLSNGDPINGKGVTIAVVDTGVYLDPFLKQKLGDLATIMFAGQADFVDKACNTTATGYKQGEGYCFRPVGETVDGNGHGTIVSSIIINGFVDVNTGVTMGIAPGARVLSIRVLGNDGTGTYADVVQGIQYAVAQKNVYDTSQGTSGVNINVMNLSSSAYATVPYFVDPINRAVETAWAGGIVVVAAAGNSGPEAETITVPGNDPYVITVGAINDKRTAGFWSDDQLPGFSATGPTLDGFLKPDILAVGTNIVGCDEREFPNRGARA